VSCPECGKKYLTRSQESITSHVYKSNVHKAMSRKDKRALYLKMMPIVDVSAIGKQEHEHELKQLLKTTGVS
jgi:hypothetical protein